MTATRKYLPREERNFTIIRLPITYRKSYLLSATVMGRFYELPNYRWLDVTFRILQVKFNIGSKTLSVKIACNYKLKGWFVRETTGGCDTIQAFRRNGQGCYGAGGGVVPYAVFK